MQLFLFSSLIQLLSLMMGPFSFKFFSKFQLIFRWGEGGGWGRRERMLHFPASYLSLFIFIEIYLTLSLCRFCFLKNYYRHRMLSYQFLLLSLAVALIFSLKKKILFFNAKLINKSLIHLTIFYIFILKCSIEIQFLLKYGL